MTRSKALAWDPSFWRGRRVLLTGHTGFKGAWLATWLVRLGAQVTGLSLPPPAAESWLWQCMASSGAGPGLLDLRGDVRDAAAIGAAVNRSDPEVVFHLAAQAIVLDSYRSPTETWGVNVMGTLELLQALARRGNHQPDRATAPVAFVGVTSDKCYENREWAWGYRESDPLGGKDPYSASKAACEILLASWRHSFGAASSVRVASARAGNVIGGGDNAPHRIVPDLLRAFAAGEPAQVRNPLSTRPYQHVLEPLAGYLLLARFVHQQGAAFEQAYNFGPLADGEQTTEWMAQKAAGLWGAGASVQVSPAAQAPHEAGILMLDSSKARRELGWTPTWDTAGALAAAVAWHKCFLQGTADGLAEASRQIELFEAGLPAGQGG